MVQQQERRGEDRARDTLKVCLPLPALAVYYLSQRGDSGDVQLIGMLLPKMMRLNMSNNAHH